MNVVGPLDIHIKYSVYFQFLFYEENQTTNKSCYTLIMLGIEQEYEELFNDTLKFKKFQRLYDKAVLRA